MKIDGVIVASPDEDGIKCTPSPLWSEDTGRAASGKMTGDIVDYKWSISVSWARLSEAQVKQILSLVKRKSKPFYKVETVDPETGEMINDYFYTGSISYAIKNETLPSSTRVYKDVQISFVQQ